MEPWIISLDRTLGLSPLANEGLWGSHTKMEQSIWCLFLGKGVPTRFRDMEIGDIFSANPSALKKKHKKTIQWWNQWNNPISWREIIQSVVFLVDSVPCALRFLLFFVTIEVWGLDRTGLGWLFLLNVWSRLRLRFFEEQKQDFWKLKKKAKPSRTHSSKHQQKQKTSLRPLKLT